MAIILAFGDSITYGSWSLVHTSWCSLLRSYMDSKFNGDYASYGRVYNLGIGGETTNEAIKRFTSETQARLRDEEKVVFIIAYGANDACFIPDQKCFRVTVEGFKKNLQKMVIEAKDFSSKIIIVNILPVVETDTSDADSTRLNRYFEPYNQTLVQMAKNNSLSLVDVNSAFQQRDYAKLFGKDGLHPNEQGHKLLFDLISPVVDKLLNQ